MKNDKTPKNRKSDKDKMVDNLVEKSKHAIEIKSNLKAGLAKKCNSAPMWPRRSLPCTRAGSVTSCHQCVWCSTPPDKTRAHRTYRPDVKCCSYWPTLSNFQVGGILAAGGPGAERVRALLAKRIGVTPRGLAPSPTWRLLYRHKDPRAFGQSLALRCPYYAEEGGGTCTVWRHREAVCATFFCKFNRGARGSALWQAMKNTLLHIEKALSWWCVEQLSPGDEMVEALLAEPESELATSDFEDRAQEDYDRWWGAWAGAEETWYRACSDRVEKLSGAQVLALAGPGLLLHLQRLKVCERIGLLSAPGENRGKGPAETPSISLTGAKKPSEDGCFKG